MSPFPNFDKVNRVRDRIKEELKKQDRSNSVFDVEDVQDLLQKYDDEVSGRLKFEELAAQMIDDEQIIGARQKISESKEIIEDQQDELVAITEIADKQAAAIIVYKEGLAFYADRYSYPNKVFTDKGAMAKEHLEKGNNFLEENNG